MDEVTKSLLSRVKKTPTAAAFLQLASIYKHHSKFFSAQVTLQEALDTLKVPASPIILTDLVALLDSMPAILGDEYLPVTKTPAEGLFLVASLLAELHLLQGHSVDALKVVTFAVKCYAASDLNEKTLWQVAICVLLEAWLKVTYIFLYRKKFEKALQCYSHLQQLEQWVESQQVHSSERLNSVLGTIHLSRFLVLKDQTALERAGLHLASVHTGEALLCYLHLTKSSRASEVVRELVQTYSEDVRYWVWLGLIEHNGAAIRKALSLEPRNWYCWAAFAYLQYRAGALEECCYSLQIAYKLDYKDYRLSLLRSLLERDLGHSEKSAELTSFAADLEPALALSQVLQSS